MKTSKLSPQKEKLVAILRDMKEHCASEWSDWIKDDRIRFVELNRGYMKEKGYEITSFPCRGTVCGRSACPLNKRQAVRLPCESCIAASAALKAFNNPPHIQ